MSRAEDRAFAHRVLIVIGLLLGTAAFLLLVYATRNVLGWILAAGFIAVALRPAVDRTQRRLGRPRWLATLVVFLAAFALFGALVALIVVPLANEMAHLVENFPQTLADARAGRGPLGRVLERAHLRSLLESHHEQIERYGSRVREPSVGVLRGAITTVAATLTIAVLAYLMVLQAPRIVHTVLAAVGERHAERVRRTGQQIGRTVTGYLSGNLVISVICGGLTFLTMALMGVPYAGVLALLVAIADLVPLVGATVGAVIAAGASFLHSTRAGVVVLVFFVVYQQVENHVLQPLIFSRVVRLNPLTVLVSLLIAADLAGIVGALLAIPAAGVIKVVIREWRPAVSRRGRVDGPGRGSTPPWAAPWAAPPGRAEPSE